MVVQSSLETCYQNFALKSEFSYRVVTAINRIRRFAYYIQQYENIQPNSERCSNNKNNKTRRYIIHKFT